jgi:hypothetical protein
MAFVRGAPDEGGDGSDFLGRLVQSNSTQRRKQESWATASTRDGNDTLIVSGGLFAYRAYE